VADSAANPSSLRYLVMGGLLGAKNEVITALLRSPVLHAAKRDHGQLTAPLLRIHYTSSGRNHGSF
jgi:hypothetical protein